MVAHISTVQCGLSCAAKCRRETLGGPCSALNLEPCITGETSLHFFVGEVEALTQHLLFSQLQCG